MPRTITRERAFEIASSWGSLIRSCDPGACFYGFPIDDRGRGDGRPADEEHRAACLAYCADNLRQVRQALRDGTAEERYGWTKAEFRELLELHRFFRFAETRETIDARQEAFDELDSFTRAYVVAALWSSTDNSDDSGGEPLDANYGPEDIASETLARMVEDCATFQRTNAGLLALAGDEEQNGHDFWLTRNGHGAGFWDRDYSGAIGDALTEASDAYGEVDLYIGDDGLIHD